MTTKRLIIFLLCCIFSHAATAQQLSVRGYIFDAYNNQDVQGANIFNLSKQSAFPAAITGEEGFFETFSFLFDTLVVTREGYHFYSFKINQEDFNDTLFIPLSPQSFSLEIDSMEGEIVNIYQDRRYHILDFFVKEKGIIVVGADHALRKYFIWHLNHAHQKTAELIFDTPRLHGCYMDYLGNTYLFKDNKKIFQFWKKGKTFALKELPNIDMDIFLAKMESLHFQEKDKIFVSMYYDLTGFSYACDVGYFTEKDYELQFLNRIRSEIVYEAVDTIVASKRSLKHWEPYLKPFLAYAPIFQLPNNIVVFDYIGAQIHLYNKKLLPVDTIHALSLCPPAGDPFTARPRWIFAGKIFQDRDKFYALYHNHGASCFKLDEINYLTGSTVRSIVIEHPFPKHIQIVDDAIYYLYKTPESDEKNGLFKQLIEPTEIVEGAEVVENVETLEDAKREIQAEELLHSEQITSEEQ
ncbi:carboxypeptidase-like regulatory domain-containing protein [Bacteroidales bacterium OttesenSCG-928-J16]|nr:carboxypeptidase-like regulatory domain-containing protein [Bacteroidales bacterium OttesenSCG-928-J16]